MRSKRFTYILLCTTILIWGIIAVKFLKREHLKTIDNSPEVLKTDIKELKPQIILKMNYRDPFIKKPLPDTIMKENISHRKMENKIGNKQDFIIICFGKFRKGSDVYYPVKINEKYYTLKKGYVVNGLYLSNIENDSLCFIKNGNKYYSKLKNTDKY